MEIHVVTPGDTLFAVAARYGVSFELLAAWNGLRPPSRTNLVLIFFIRSLDFVSVNSWAVQMLAVQKTAKIANKSLCIFLFIYVSLCF